MGRRRPTPYVPLSVHYADDEAIMAVGEDAELMFVRMMAYAGRTPMTEGFVSRRVCLTRLGVDERPELGPESAPEKRLERLVDSGLIEARNDGFQLVSWLRWNRSVEEMGRERESDRERKTPPTRENAESEPESEPESAPIPPPVSGGQIQIQKTEKNIRSIGIDHDGSLFAEFWSVYPKRGKHSNPRAPALAKWAIAIRKATPESIIAAAKRYAEARRGESPQHTAQAATWLHQERWNDELTGPEPEDRDPNSSWMGMRSR